MGAGLKEPLSYLRVETLQEAEKQSHLGAIQFHLWL